jgi:hypothetical protein
MKKKYFIKPGDRYGKLVVIGFAYSKRVGKRKDFKHFYTVLCDCGIEKQLQSGNLTTGRTNSCGCSKSDWVKLPHGVAAMRHTINGYKQAAKKRGILWDLTDEQFYNLTQSTCKYCGCTPKNRNSYGRKTGDYVYNGIDRVDSNLHYTIDNVVPCCKRCNLAKNDMTMQEFYEWIHMAHSYIFNLGTACVQGLNSL